MGGPEQTRDFARLVSIPGAGGCGGSPSFQAFEALQAWVEEGKAPASNFFNVRATGQTITGSSSSVQVQGLRFPAAACAIDL